MNLTFDKVLSELDSFPELGLDSCQASLTFDPEVERLDLFYKGGKLSMAILYSEEEPVDIVANAVMIPGIPREIPSAMTVTVVGHVGSSSRPYADLRTSDRDHAFEAMPGFDFWATQANSRMFEDEVEQELWLRQVGFRVLPSFKLRGSATAPSRSGSEERGIRRLTSLRTHGSHCYYGAHCVLWYARDHLA